MNSHLTNLPAPSVQMISYRLNLTTQDFFNILYWLEEKAHYGQGERK
jgi:hypothetical protein